MSNNSKKDVSAYDPFSSRAGEAWLQGRDGQHIESIDSEEDLGDFVVWSLPAGPGLAEHTDTGVESEAGEGGWGQIVAIFPWKANS